MASCRKKRQQIELVYILFSLRWYVELILQGRTLSLYSNSSMVCSEEEPALQCRGQHCAGLIVIEAWFRGYWGSPGLEGLRTAGLYPLAGLLDYEDTRLKTSSRVQMGLSLAWKASLAMRIFMISYHCNQLHVTLTLSGVYINRRVVVRRTSTP